MASASKLFGRVDNGKIVPTTQCGGEVLSRIKSDEIIGFTVKQSRNMKFHKLYWQIMGITSECLKASGRDMTSEQVHMNIKIHMGRYKPIEFSQALQRKTGQTHYISVSSTSFDKMDQIEFGEFVNSAVTIIENDICPFIYDSPHALELNQIIAEFRK